MIVLVLLTEYQWMCLSIKVHKFIDEEKIGFIWKGLTLDSDNEDEFEFDNVGLLHQNCQVWMQQKIHQKSCVNPL